MPNNISRASRLDALSGCPTKYTPLTFSCETSRLFLRFRLRWRSRRGKLRLNRQWLPSRNPLKNALGALGGRDVAVIILDHLYGSSHLLGEKIYVNAFHEAEGCVGVAGKVGGGGVSDEIFIRAGFVRKIL